MFDSQHNSGFIVAPQNWSTTSPNAEGVNKKGQSSWLQKTHKKPQTNKKPCVTAACNRGYPPRQKNKLLTLTDTEQGTASEKNLQSDIRKREHNKG